MKKKGPYDVKFLQPPEHKPEQLVQLLLHPPEQVPEQVPEQEQLELLDVPEHPEQPPPLPVEVPEQPEQL